MLRAAARGNTRSTSTSRLPGHRGRSFPPNVGCPGSTPLTVRSACRIQYWALTTLQKWRVRRRSTLVERRSEACTRHARSREQGRTENLLILLQSLIVTPPGTHENRGVKSAQSNGGLADEYRCLRQHHADGRTRC